MARRWSDEELLGALRAAAADLGEPLRLVDFRGWRREHPEAPGELAITRRFRSSWPAALRAAGLGQYGWTDDELLDAVAACATDLGRVPTLLDYRAWRDRQAEAQPSTSTIEQRLGGWAAAVARPVDPARRA